LCIGHEIGGSVVLPDTSVRWRDYPYAQTVNPARGVQGLVLTCKHDRQNRVVFSGSAGSSDPNSQSES
jgi:hypothetical protein